MTDTPALTPDEAAALAALMALETRHQTRGRKQLDETLKDAEEVDRVYQLCAVIREPRIKPLDWLNEHWGMKPRKAQLLRTLHQNRAILPGNIQPTAAMLLVAEEADETAVNQVLAMIRAEQRVTVDEVKAILRAPILARAAGELSKYLLARHEDKLRGKEIAAELRSIAELMDDALAAGTVDADDTYALTALFTHTVQDYTARRQQAHIEENYVVNEFVPMRLHVEGGVARLIALETPAALLDPQWEGQTFMVPMRKAAA